MEIPQHGIERMLHGAGVAARRGGCHLLALVQGHAHAGLGKEGRRRAANDAAADDRHVGGSAHSPLA